MKIFKIFFITLVFLGSVSIANAQEFNFFRNLKIGDSGPDVLELQKILNKNQDTQISLSGVGSPGNETTYFGNLTHQAVIRFQEKFRSQILTPLNLFSGTGFVGQSTINKLKDFSVGSITNNTVVSKNSGSPKIISISPNEGIGNETITIKGENFGSSNTVFVTFDNPDKYKNIKSKNNGTEIELKLDSSLYKSIKETEKGLSSSQKKIFREQSPNYDLYITVLTNGKYSNPQKFILKVE